MAQSYQTTKLISRDNFDLLSKSLHSYDGGAL